MGPSKANQTSFKKGFTPWNKGKIGLQKHIKSFSKYPELRFDISNGITLCRECHKLTDNYGGKPKK